MNKVKLLSVIEIINYNQYLSFCQVSLNSIILALKNLHKDNEHKQIILIITKKKFQKDIKKQISSKNIKLLNNKTLKYIFLPDDVGNQNYFNKIINFYNNQNFDILIKLKGNQIINKEYFSDILKSISSGNQLIFKNIISLDLDNYIKNFGHYLKKNYLSERFIYAYMHQNFNEILNLNTVDIKKNKNNFSLKKNIPNLLALSGKIDSKFNVNYDFKNFKNFIYQEIKFDQICTIKVKSLLFENYPLRKNTILKLIKEINKIPYTNLMNVFKNKNKLLIEKISKNKKNIKKQPIMNIKIKSLDISYYFKPKIRKNYDYLKNFMTYNAFKNYFFKKNKNTLFYLVVLICFLPFKIKWYFYQLLSKKIKNEFMIYLINKTIILPRSFIFKIVFKKI